jgi:hypothetical protein
MESCATSMEGGLGLPVKMVQERMGYSSITLTANLYSHLFPSDDDGSEMERCRESAAAGLGATQARHTGEKSNKNNVRQRLFKPLVGSSNLSPGTN